MSAVVEVEELLRARSLTCRGTLLDLSCDVVQRVRAAEPAADPGELDRCRDDLQAVTSGRDAALARAARLADELAEARSAAAGASIAADCYQLALERLVDRLWPFAGLPGEARRALEDAVELLRADAADVEAMTA